MNRRSGIVAALVLPLLVLRAVPSGAQETGDSPSVDPTTVPATLMLTVEDMLALEDAIANGPLARSDRPTDDAPEDDPWRFRLKTNLYLSSIIHAGPESWIIWVNGTAYRPGRRSPLFEVVEVGPERVTLAVPWGEGGTRDVVLAPHQTFVPGTGKIVEGRP